MKGDKHKKNGYILFYVIIAGALFSALAVSMLVSTLRELEISEEGMNAIKARFAAEAGVECINYWQTSSWPRPLDTSGDIRPAKTIHCNTLMDTVSFTPEAPDGDPKCKGYIHEMRIGPFAEANDQCAEVVVEIMQHSATPMVCTTRVTAHGYSDCSASPLTQRTIWSQP